MALTPGTRFGSFEISSLLGAGGMGEVYAARDTRLDRRVAIKVLLDSFAGDPDRRARFEREARLLAALNHPCISQIFYRIFYRNGDRMMAVELKATAAGIELSQPKMLFERRYSFGAGITISNYDVTADGQRFLMVKDEELAGRLRVVHNWRPDAPRVP